MTSTVVESIVYNPERVGHLEVDRVRSGRGEMGRVKDRMHARGLKDEIIVEVPGVGERSLSRVDRLRWDRYNHCFAFDHLVRSARVREE